jgi:TRAP-type C4-dicarboxylate transport system substrate-binding protein
MVIVEKLFLAAGLSIGLAGTASAEIYTFSGWLAPTHVMTREGQVGWADMVREATKGEIDFEVHPGAAILPPLSTLQGVGDGVAQGGHITPLYHPSEMPVNYLSGQAGGYSTNPDFFVLSAAYLDYAMHDPDAYAEWSNYNIVPLITISTPIYHFICATEINSLADMKGKKVRAPGGVWAGITEAFGMIAVNLPFNELYTAMERGAVDCAAMDMANLTSGATVLDLAKSAVMVPISPGYNAAQVSLNQDFWNSQTEANRRIMLDKAAIAMARAIVVYNNEARAATEEGVAKGLKIVEPTEEMLGVQKDFSAKWYDAVVKEGKEQRGLADPAAVLAAEQAYIDKWTKLLEGLDKSDADAFAKILSDNLFSQVDVKTYGME